VIENAIGLGATKPAANERTWKNDDEKSDTEIAPEPIDD
jgi:hypothetical protein